MAQFSFNASSAPQPSAPQRGPLPPGSYEVIIVKSDVRETKAGTGEYIELEMQVIDGEFRGRRVWERLNVNNPNKQAEDIARAALGQLCLAVGLPVIEDTREIHDIPFIIGVEIDRKDPTRNRVMSYGQAAAPAPKPAPAKPAAPAGARPWAR